MNAAAVSQSGRFLRTGAAPELLVQPGTRLSPEALRIERLLATARMVVAIYTSAALSTATADAGALSVVFAAGYVGMSATFWSLLRVSGRVLRQFPAWSFSADFAVAALATLVVDHAQWSLFGLYLFVPVQAAFRWGMPLALAATGGLLSILGARVLLTQNVLVAEPFSYIAIAGVMVGFIAGKEKQCREESAAIAGICSGMRVERGMMGSLKQLFPKLRDLTGARAILLVAREPRHGRLFLWRLCDAPATDVRSTELVPSEHDVYLFPMSDEAWYVVNPSDLASRLLPRGFAARHPFRSLFAVSLSFGPEWQARAFVLDPTANEKQLPFLVRVLREVGPALHSIYLQGRMHSRIGEMERARVARELHDQTIQSLIGLEMELAAWRRSGSDRMAAPPERLADFQNRLHEEILNLRELMQQLRPVYTEPRKLLSYMSDLVERFQRETGIAASFVTGVDQVDISQEVCGALIRILQEALVNVRKHSGARNVTVMFGAKNRRWSLVIDDDGRGFDFSGRCPLDLDPRCNGPSIIQERVSLLGGDLTVDSDPGRGARLEITVPGALDA